MPVCRAAILRPKPASATNIHFGKSRCACQIIWLLPRPRFFTLWRNNPRNPAVCHEGSRKTSGRNLSEWFTVTEKIDGSWLHILKQSQEPWGHDISMSPVTPRLHFFSQPLSCRCLCYEEVLCAVRQCLSLCSTVIWVQTSVWLPHSFSSFACPGSRSAVWSHRRVSVAFVTLFRVTVALFNPCLER